ncbi:phosphotransferase family protein [Rummeliibacillus sp. G93]|uniref:aminoglycoside phosphotransferase family protein n=1 Tax=Rummeliibacillus sp. G93 TaxID=2939494 RepID=UPI00201C350C|nr:phosphotransferase family protein [Rummeliibacillus sp. G93]UQW98729.1 phosphotransferase family protein [Rummeliibacillus sp. G93]
MHILKEREKFKLIKPIMKGWSTDKKYFVENELNQKMLLRIAEISLYDEKIKEFEAMKHLAECKVPVSNPIKIGICNDGKSVYSLFNWCEGEDAEIALKSMTEIEQYRLGKDAGRILKEIHRIPAPESQEEWKARFSRKADSKIKMYQDCGLKIKGGEKIISYIQNNKHLLEGRTQCFQHGDYHVGNMIISSKGELSIIDFNRNDYGDPWEEFNRIVWSATISPHFATGQLNGYFNGRPPIDFFKLLVFYICSNMLSSIPWAIPFGEDQVTIMKNQAKDVLTWFNGMDDPIPTWYLEDYYI